MKQEAIALYRGNVQRTGEYQAVGVPDLHGIAWQFQTGGSVDLTPVVADGIVLLMSRTDRTMYALDAPSGERRWHVPLSGEILDPPDVAAGVVYVSDGSIHALHLQTGQLLWTWNARNLPSREKLRALHGCSDEGYFLDEDALEAMFTAEEVYGDGGGFRAPACYKEKLYLLFSETIVLALDLATRELIWWTSVWGGASSPLTIDRGLVHFTAFYTQNDDVLHGLDSQTGGLTFPSVDMLHNEDEKLICNPGAFAFRDHLLYAVWDEGLCCREITSEEARWITELPKKKYGKYAECLAVGQTMVYVTTVPDDSREKQKSYQSIVMAYDRESGQVVWQRSDLADSPSRIRFPTLAGSVLYLILDGQICCALDAATGQERWRLHLEAGILAPPCIAGEMIFVSAGQSVYALR